MDLVTLDVPKTEAEEKYRDFKNLVAADLTAEDRAIMAGYHAIARGNVLVDLAETVIAGGLDENNRPRLAACQADQSWCYLAMSGMGHWRRPTGLRATFSRTPNPAANALHPIVVSGFPVPEGYETPYQDNWRIRAMVPYVPPAHRPVHSLANYVTLWEVEEWAASPIPPRDPALLKHVRGDLYALLATWDLTDLERSVLAERVRL